MPDRDTALLRAGDVTEALQLLTRIPVPHAGPYRGAQAAWAYPLVGIAVGGIGALVAVWTGGMPAMISAGLVLAVMIALTGALHEDGLADTADGLWGGGDTARRLEIMKDSRIGAFGVIALILGLGLKWAAMGAIASSGGFWVAVLAAAIISRAPMVAVMYVLPQARADGLSSQTGKPRLETTQIAIGLAILAGVIALGYSALLLIVLLCAVTLAIIVTARRKIGGQTGDILGATQHVCEIAVLIFIAA